MRTPAEIVDAYMARYADAPTKTLAEMIAGEHGAIFTVERARSMIRYRRGAVGKKNRKSTKQTTPDTKPSKWTAGNPRQIPDSCARTFEPYRMPDGMGLVLSDIHAPYHHVDSLNAALNYGLENGATWVLINGDLVDFHGLSRHKKDPTAESMRTERRIAIEILQAIRDRFPDAVIVLKEGNHEERLADYVYERAIAIYMEEIAGVPAFLRLNDFGIEHVADQRPIYAGKLAILHGHELTRGISAPVNPARGAFLRTHEPAVLVGHSHQTSQHSQPSTITRSLKRMWSTGCLCDLRPRYDRYNRWNHGFAFVDSRTIDFRVRNLVVNDGTIWTS